MLRFGGTWFTFYVHRSTGEFVAGLGGRSVDVAVEELTAASAHAVEDRRVTDSLHLEMPADASENFLFANPSPLKTRPVVALLLP